MTFNDGLQRAAPETAGVNPKDIIAFLEDAKKCNVELHNFMLYRAGAVIAEASWWPYQSNLPHMLHSATKSFLSAAVGLAIDEGFFQLDTKVVDVFPDRVPSDGSPNLSAMTVEHLLTQTSGHDHGVSGGEWRSIESSWIDEFFSLPVLHKPGIEFVYTSATSFMLSAIITKTTGQTVRDFLEPRLFRPLGIKLLKWDIGPGPEYICPGGNGISCLPSDFLKLGILHLQKGKWQGRQILPEAWVESATTSQRGNAHGYHWWTNSDGQYWASGMFGQFAVVFPEHDAVLITTGAVPQGASRLRDVMWRHFPRMFEVPSEDQNESVQTLSGYTAGLRVLPTFQPSHLDRKGIEDRISMERFSAKQNDDAIFSFALDFHEDHCIFHLQDTRGFHQLRVGLEDWQKSETTLTGARLHHGYEPGRLPVVAGGRWSSEDTFTIKMQFIETAFGDEITIRFMDDYTIASLDRKVNVNSFSTRRPTVFGAILVSGDELSSKKFQDITKAKMEYSTSTTTVGQLLDNSETRQILLEEIPSILDNPRLEKAREYTLDLIVRYARLDMSDLARIDKRLALV